MKGKLPGNHITNETSKRVGLCPQKEIWRNHQGLKNSIAFNGERKVQKGEGVWLVKAKPEDHEWHQEKKWFSK